MPPVSAMQCYSPAATVQPAQRPRTCVQLCAAACLRPWLRRKQLRRKRSASVQLACTPCCTGSSCDASSCYLPKSRACCPARRSSPSAQLDNLTGLQHLALVDCGASEESMQQLAALPLQDLDIEDSWLPPCVSALTGLTSLAITHHDEGDLDMLDASLPCLTGLSRLALTTVTNAVEQLPACLPQLRSLTRLCLTGQWQPDIFADEAVQRGTWLARLRWLVSLAGWLVRPLAWPALLPLMPGIL